MSSGATTNKSRRSRANGARRTPAQTSAAKTSRATQQAEAGLAEPTFVRPRWTRAYSFGLVTGALFLFAWLGQFLFQLISERNEAAEHGQSLEWSQFLPTFFASTLENWQSEFLQLVWQAAGLALFYYWGSSQSREGDDRIEAKLDMLLRERGIEPPKAT